MARKVFFSFQYEDVQRVMTVRNSNVIEGVQKSGVIDKAEFEQLARQGDIAVRNWIDRQIEGTSVTVVLVGPTTNKSKWVQYEIQKSIERGNGILSINISQIPGWDGRPTTCCGLQVKGYPNYNWVSDSGYRNIGVWVEQAARNAGR